MVIFNDKRHYYFIVAYVVFNYILHVFSIPDAVYIHGADASRYYSSALSLSSGNGFGDLLYTVPVYPFFLSLHYKILGFNYGNDLLIITQSILIYLTGFIAGKLAGQIQPYSIGWIVMLLVILNPNSVINAHFVQTESLFSLFLIVYFYILIKLLKNKGSIVTLALIALLVSLTRPAGMYAMLAFILPSIFLLKNITWRKWLSINLIYYFILLSGLGLWSLNNYDKHGEFFISAHEGGVFHDQYVALLQYGKDMSTLEAEKYADAVYDNVLIKESGNCNGDNSQFKCRKIIAKAYIQAMLKEDFYVISKAGVSSFLNLMLSGGASNFANYYGIDNKPSVAYFEKSSGSMLSLEKMKMFISSVNLEYFFILVLFWGYSILVKVLFIIGLAHLFKNSNNKYLFITLLFYILIFTAIYLFLGQSRWRVPLEPIIIIFSALGVYKILSLNKKGL